MRIRKSATLVLLAGLFACVGDSRESEQPERRPIHRDGQALERAMLGAIGGYLLADRQAVLDSLKAIEPSCHRLDVEGWPGLNRGMYTYDRGLHAAVEKAGRFAEANLLKESFDLFVSAQRACLHCHLIAREEEILPLEGALPPR